MKKRIKRSITDLSSQELENEITAFGQPAYRARQITARVYRNLAWSWDELVEVPRTLRDYLSGRYPLHGIKPVTAQTAADGTVKTLFRLTDGRTIEAAMMLYRRTSGTGKRGTVCVSTQVGCGIGCPFCSTGQGGFERNLSSGEIVDHVLHFARLLRDDYGAAEKESDNILTNIVFMGMGEPLANYEELMKAVRVLNNPEGMNIGARSMTISTAGVVPGIRKLAEEKLQLGLAVSLHAGTDAVRNRLVPLNRKYPVAEVIDACRHYFALTGRRVSYEYVLFKGINDSLSEARHLGALLKGQNCHVNLIPANDTGRDGFQAPPHGEVLAFMTELKKSHITVTIRRSRGQDIDAGCGQLRSRMNKKPAEKRR